MQQGVNANDGGSDLPFGIIHPSLPMKGNINISFYLNMIRFAFKIYIAVFIPMRIPFEEIPHPAWVVMDNIIHVICFIDMIIVVNTAYYDADGHLITSRKKILIKYLKFEFWTHIMAIFPLTMIRYYRRGGSFDDTKNTFEL